MNKKLSSLIILVLIVTMGSAGCLGGNDEPEPEPDPPYPPVNFITWDMDTTLDVIEFGRGSGSYTERLSIVGEGLDPDSQYLVRIEYIVEGDQGFFVDQQATEGSFETPVFNQYDDPELYMFNEISQEGYYYSNWFAVDVYFNYIAAGNPETASATLFIELIVDGQVEDEASVYLQYNKFRGPDESSLPTYGVAVVNPLEMEYGIVYFDEVIYSSDEDWETHYLTDGSYLIVNNEGHVIETFEIYGSGTTIQIGD